MCGELLMLLKTTRAFMRRISPLPLGSFDTRISLRQRNVIPVPYPLQHEECGASAAAVGDQMRAPWADWSPALAGLEFDLFIGIAQGDPHAALQDIEGVLDIGVVVPAREPAAWGSSVSLRSGILGVPRYA